LLYLAQISIRELRSSTGRIAELIAKLPEIILSVCTTNKSSRSPRNNP
jgi:hypothetical protein